MNRFPQKNSSADSAVEARAATWLAQRDAGFSAREELEFARWRDADPRHAAAIARLDAAWAALIQLRDFRPDARAHPDRDLLAPAHHRRRLAFPALLVAAAAMLALAFVWEVTGGGASAPLDDTKVYSTTAEGYQRLTLADGSIVELNDRSEVRVRYTAAARHVRLVRGEAHFTVAKNKARPFFVETTAVAVRAVGTAFDVRLEPSRVDVLVTEGRVQLRRTAALRAGPSAAADVPLLSAGWRARVPERASDAIEVEPVPPDVIREELAWQAPRLLFVETPLGEVLAQFNRRNRIQVSLADPELANLPVGGSFRAENVEAFVRLLASNGDITVERPSPGRIVLHKVR